MTDHRPSLADLEDRAAFAGRHIGPGATDIPEMLAAVGVPTSGSSIDETVPASIRLAEPLALPDPLTETRGRRPAARDRLAEHRDDVADRPGLPRHDQPPVIQRNVLENPAWYTAYTPYQPEISQGRLEALLNFQTLVADLTGLPLANASLLDEGTAAAEAMTMARRVGKSDVAGVLCRRRLPPADDRGGDNPCRADRHRGRRRRSLERDLPDGMFGALLAYPGSSGVLRDLSPVAERVHAAGAWPRDRRRPAGDGADDDAGADGRGHRGGFHAAVRRPDGVRRSARRVHGHPRRTRAGAARPSGRACRWTAPDARRCASPCRRASNTSVARRPRATSAPPRCSSRSSPACTPRGTVRTGCAASPAACIG